MCVLGGGGERGCRCWGRVLLYIYIDNNMECVCRRVGEGIVIHLYWKQPELCGGRRKGELPNIEVGECNNTRMFALEKMKSGSWEDIAVLLCILRITRNVWTEWMWNGGGGLEDIAVHLYWKITLNVRTEWVWSGGGGLECKMLQMWH